ncbi:hypothetical protein N0O29_003646 [Acinetobacter baumannii]|nr:hypothetical protein [Acinetobacter baumannii]EKU2035486.1 hypothetical protein [Acinetobacter baumannii]EKV9006144.1 hypothetical protein [Acinetobacter baumannii]EKW0568200.1 hypothetical protein [Acinetobacter baumannii]
MENQIVVQEKRGVVSLRNASRYGLGAVLSAGILSSASAATLVDEQAAQFKTDGIAMVTAIGVAMISVAVVAVLIKWSKATFFS